MIRYVWPEDRVGGAGSVGEGVAVGVNQTASTHCGSLNMTFTIMKFNF
jgi:hypothetical protein